MPKPTVPAHFLSFRGGPFLALSIASFTFAGSPFEERGVVIVHELAGDNPSWGFGSAVAHMRDITGDGVQELIVNEPFHSGIFPNNGRAAVFSGTTGKMIPGLSFTGAAANVFLGQAIADAGDVNRDGVSDVIVGSPGQPFGASTIPGRIDVFSGVDGTFLIGREGEMPGDKFGYAVAGAGDVNRDRHDDVLVGAAFFDTTGPGGGLNAGRAYVLSGADASIIRFWDGEDVQDKFGGGIAACGDLDDDGFVDHVVGAFDAGPTAAGRAYVYSGATGKPMWPAMPFLAPPGPGFGFGQFFVGAAGDVNRDGTPDVYVGDYSASRAYAFSGIDGAILMNLAEGAPGGMGCGRFAGDVNGDGYDDLVLGAFTSDAGALNAGKTYIYSGKDSTLLRTVTATTPNHGFGWDAVGVGDVNGDGAPDFLVGAAGGGGDRAYVISGNPLPRVCAEDLDGSGVVNGVDLAMLLGTWGACPPPSPGGAATEVERGLTKVCPTDFNGDGIINGIDLAMLLAAWGACR